MRWMLRSIGPLALALLLTGAVRAANPDVNWTKEDGHWVATFTVVTDAGAGGSLEVKDIAGSVDVTGSKAKTATVTVKFRLNERASRKEAEKEFADVRPTVTNKGDRVKVEGEKHRWGWGHSNYSLSVVAEVPATFNLRGNSQGGSLTTEGLSGEVDFATGGGSITVRNHQGEVKTSTGGGSIQLDRVKGTIAMSTGGGSIQMDDVEGELRCTTGGGSIDLMRVTSTDNASLTTGGGSIEVEEVSGSFRLTTGGGGLDLRDSQGDLRVTTGGGSVDLRNLSGTIDASTGGGAIRCRYDDATTAKKANIQLATGYGDVDIYLPADAPMTVTARVNDYRRRSDIRSDFPVEPETRGRDDLFASLTLNGGGGSIDARTNHSRIMIHKR